MGLLTKFREKVDEFKQQKSIAQANKLAELKKERIKVEGRAKIAETYNKEQDRIERANERVKEANRPTGLGKFVAAIREKNQAAQQRVSGQNQGPVFGGSTGWNTNVPTGSGMGNPGWGSFAGNEKKAEPKKKQRRIVIYD